MQFFRFFNELFNNLRRLKCIYLLCCLFADVEPLVFSFRVKFFPADPFRLTGNSKIMIYQQLKRDLIHGRLYCSAGEAAALGSLIVQGIYFFFTFIYSHERTIDSMLKWEFTRNFFKKYCECMNMKDIEII